MAMCEDGDSFFLEVDVKYNGESVSGCYEDSAGTRNSITRYSMDGETDETDTLLVYATESIGATVSRGHTIHSKWIHSWLNYIK